jgi:anaerobic dimethyl sulfoxide reductase subunit A
MEEAEVQVFWISVYDAKKRGIKNGEKVCIYNARGKVILAAKVTPRIMPGVVSIPQGGWWSPDKEGIDQRGCINTLTKYQPTPLAFANPQHTNLVEVVKLDQMEAEG